MRFLRLLAATTSAAVVVATLLPQVSGGTSAESRNSVDGQSAADSHGNLHVPKDYRSGYEYLGRRLPIEKGAGCKADPYGLCIARDCRRLPGERTLP